MKKYTQLTLAVVLGSSLTLGVNQFLQQEEPDQVVHSVQPTDPMVQQVNMPVSGAGQVDLRLAAQNSVNGVVHIKTISKVNHATSYSLYDYFFGRAPQQHMQPVMGSGSGVIISSDGFVVTNNHVIRGAEQVEVTLNNKKSYQAEVIGSDPSTDLALLKIEGEKLPYVQYGNSDEVAIGEWVLAVGNPFNLTSTVTAGIVSAKGRDINILENDRRSGLAAVESFIQTDAAVNPGNSGGALVNARGELIGINTAIKSNTGSYTGYSFAVPVNIVQKVVDDLAEFGKVQRAFMGVRIRDIDQDLAEEAALEDLYGVYIDDVIEDGPALEAGMKKGDVIRAIGRVPVKDIPELQEQISKYRPGDVMEMVVLREGREVPVKLVLANEYGETALIPAEKEASFEVLGARVAELPQETCHKLGIRQGVRVEDLKSGKMLSAGIKEGFIITRVDKEPVATVEDFQKLMQGKSGGVLIEGVYPNGQRAYYGFGI